MKKYYQGKYPCVNISKYKGNHKEIYYRSKWELLVFRWCDLNADVIEWNSEEHVIPYICRTDKKQHRYFVDLYIKYKTGKMVLIEIKPESQSKEPKITKRKKQTTYIAEALTWEKNKSKWEAAHTYCVDRGMSFQVWGEKALLSIGINVSPDRKPK